jgi:hypothetical protein
MMIVKEMCIPNTLLFVLFSSQLNSSLAQCASSFPGTNTLCLLDKAFDDTFAFDVIFSGMLFRQD